MIPSHTLSNDQTSNVVINRLSKSNDYDFSEPHRHDYYELFYFQKGGGEHEIDFKPFEIESDSFQLVAPGQVHQMKRAPGSMGFVFLFNNEDIIIELPENAGDVKGVDCLDANDVAKALKLSDSNSLAASEFLS